MPNKTKFINLLHSPGRPRTVPTKANISKAKYRLAQKTRVLTRRLATEFDISRTSAQRM